MEARPYAPSWLDVVTDGIRRIPVPSWVIYLLIGVILSLARTIVAWIDGSYPVGTFFHVHVLDGLIPVYFVFVIHYLDDMSARALAEYRSKLTGTASYDELRYRLTTMPALATAIIAVLGFVFGALYIQFLLSPVDIQLSKYFTSPTAAIVDTILSGLSGLMMSMFAWHTIRQLRMISRIYTRNTTVSIFDIGALYALSRVTALTAVALLVFSYVYVAFYINGGINSVSNAVVLGAILVIAVLAFVVPLWGAHRLLQKEKGQRLGDVGRHLETASNTLHGKIDSGEFSDEATRIRDALDGLIKERDVVAKASTWPWEPEAVRAVITAVLLPILIWIVTRVLSNLGF